MCHSNKNRSNKARVVAAASTTQPRCFNCYKKAPYHRKDCSVAATTIDAAQRRNPDSPPPYDHSAPIVVAYESRYIPHGPIGFAARWGYEHFQKKRDEKKFMQEFETRRGIERQSSSGSDASSRRYETIGDDFVNDQKRTDVI